MEHCAGCAYGMNGVSMDKCRMISRSIYDVTAPLHRGLPSHDYVTATRSRDLCHSRIWHHMPVEKIAINHMKKDSGSEIVESITSIKRSRFLIRIFDDVEEHTIEKTLSLKLVPNPSLRVPREPIHKEFSSMKEMAATLKVSLLGRENLFVNVDSHPPEMRNVRGKEVAETQSRSIEPIALEIP